MPDETAVESALSPECRLSHAILDSLPVSMAVLDAEGWIVFANQAWVRYAASEAGPGLSGCGTNYLALAEQAAGPLADEGRQAFAGVQAVLGGLRREFSLRYAWGTGAEQRWFLLQATPLAVAAAGCAVLSHQDITAPKNPADAGRFSELRYRGLFENASDGILILEETAGTIMDLNSRLLQFLGGSAGDFTGKKIWEIPGLETIARDQAAFQKLRARDFVHLEDVLLTPGNGPPRHFEFVSSAYDGELGRLIQCNLRDISERRQAEKALQESQLRLELAIKASLVGPWDWNLVTNEVTYSPEWKSQIGHSPDSLTNQLSEWENRLHPDDHDRIMAEVEAYLARPAGALDLEFRLRHKDGSYRWINSRGQLFRDAAGRPSRLAGCHLDITERKSLEEQFRQAQKMESIGRLAGGVAHDFNNLLTIILGYSDLLLADPATDAGAQDSLTEIKRAGERAAALTRQLLAFSRKQVLEPAVLDLNVIVSDCEKMLKRLLGEDVELVVRLAPDLGRVRADASQLEQVLMNLAINARDAMPQGGKLIIETGGAELEESRAHPHPGLKPGRYLVLTVRDTGVGMDEATKGRIFEPFFTTKEPGKGTGLGLAMVFGFIKQSGGHVAVVSQPGLGSTFKIYLPEVEVAPLSEVATGGQTSVSEGFETILLVEDEDGVRALARHILQNRGYSVLAAACGAEALLLAQSHPHRIHLLISDVVMPGMGGRQLAEEVAALRPGIKTLFISGYTDDTIMRHGIQTSETAFLHKPFTVEALPLKVRKVLDQ